MPLSNLRKVLHTLYPHFKLPGELQYKHSGTLRISCQVGPPLLLLVDLFFHGELAPIELLHCEDVSNH